MAAETVQARLASHAAGADLVIIEGVMGLFDGGQGGAGSTASLAAMTGLPVVLIVGAQGLAQTAAAVAEGCARLAEKFEVAGAIVNQVASDRHAALIREGFERSSVPLLGLVRRDPAIALPSRHLGLVQAEEHEDLQVKIGQAATLVAQGCDLDDILSRAGRIPSSSPSLTGGGKRLPPLGQHIAVARDVAFAFAYPHLLGDWREQGAEISFFSPLMDESPAFGADAVFLPGGYPELHAGRLASAAQFRAGMQQAAARGALVYGECGGYMMLGETLTDADGQAHRMLGLLAVSTSFARRKLHLGYRRLRPISDLPWSEPLSAHEFHFASIVEESGAERLFKVEDTGGASLGSIGLRRGKVMGSFAHIIDAG
jgi:cobyrinic acid a,c-diamide synthase